MYLTSQLTIFHSCGKLIEINVFIRPLLCVVICVRTGDFHSHAAAHMLLSSQ